MAKKKKKQNLGPKRKRMNRKTRLIHAQEWMKKYEGKNIIKGYAKWYGVDLICAMTELEMLGHPISGITKEKTKKSMADRIHQKKLQKEKRKQKQTFLEEEFEFDYDFAFIAGYTEGGAPFGITYEEMEEMEKRERNIIATIDDNEEDWEIEDFAWEYDWLGDDWLEDSDDEEIELSDQEIEEFLLTAARMIDCNQDEVDSDRKKWNQRYITREKAIRFFVIQRNSILMMTIYLFNECCLRFEKAARLH